MLGALITEAEVTKCSLKAVLLGDPVLLEHEIWRIFETEPAPRSIGLLAAGNMSGGPERWEVALVELAKTGRISRERLLDATIDGLSRDLHERRARWFAVLHDRLEPTSEELAARFTRYSDLLGSRNPSTVALGAPSRQRAGQGGTA